MVSSIVLDHGFGQCSGVLVLALSDSFSENIALFSVIISEELSIYIGLKERLRDERINMNSVE